MSNLTATYSCPSNIALVKYWGKKTNGIQLPANPSISFTLTDLVATTQITAAISSHPNTEPQFLFELNGSLKPSFEPKIKKFLNRIWESYPILHTHTLHIQSKNNFPHGAGIASSAAGFGALAICIVDLQSQLNNSNFISFTEASTIARLGSGSACRSLFAKPAAWGISNTLPNSSDLHAVEFNNVHADFGNWKDIVLIVDPTEKSVSSTDGHNQLTNNIYANARYEAANVNFNKVIKAMEQNNVPLFIQVVESEALQLHAMMMVSPMHYILMRPNTLAIIEKIWQYRSQTNLPFCFTLDAGANVHLLYKETCENEILDFVKSQLLPNCTNEQYLCSNTGSGPIKLQNFE